MSPAVSAKTRRGDTIIEVLFAIAIFSMVAIMSIAIMNQGVSNAETALELVTARNELNAQAEALRFVHSSYIAERTLPEHRYNDLGQENERYQQYRPLWDAIIEHAITPVEATEQGLYDLGNLINSNEPGKIHGCERVYDTADGNSILQKLNAFVLNTRNLSSIDGATNAYTTDVNLSYVSITNRPTAFIPAQLGARMVFRQSDTQLDENDSTMQFTDNQELFNVVAAAEGIWAVAVTSNNNPHEIRPEYYDFYIQTCWYGPGSTAPTAVDTVIRLYNPENF